MSCLTDFDSILVASPFNKMCLNYAEIIMMTLVALSVLVAMIVLISNLVLFQRLNNYRNFIKILRVGSNLGLEIFWMGLYGSWNTWHFDIKKDHSLRHKIMLRTNQMIKMTSKIPVTILQLSMINLLSVSYCLSKRPTSLEILNIVFYCTFLILAF